MRHAAKAFIRLLQECRIGADCHRRLPKRGAADVYVEGALCIRRNRAHDDGRLRLRLWRKTKITS
jgi:hypothetical protein